MSIHYSYKSKSGERLMRKEAKRQAKFARRKIEKREDIKQKQMHDINKTITLEDITR